MANYKVRMRRAGFPGAKLSKEDFDKIKIPPEVEDSPRTKLTEEEVKSKKDALLKEYIKYSWRKLDEGDQGSFETAMYRLIDYYNDLNCNGLCDDHCCLICHDHDTCNTCQRDKEIFSQFGKYVRVKEDHPSLKLRKAG